MSTDDLLRRNNVKISGDGSHTRLLAHGFGCDQNMWRLVTPFLLPHYRIVLFDYVGSGRSELKAYDAERYSRLEGYAQDILEICDVLDLEGATLVGHSVSSMISLIASLAEPRFFDRLAMIAGNTPALDKFPAGLLVTDSERKILYANRYFETRFGFEPDELHGSDVLDLMSRASAIMCESYVLPLLLHERRCEEMQLVVLDSTGNEVAVIINAVWEDGDEIYWSIYCSIQRDKLYQDLVEARQSLEDRAFHETKSKGGNTSGVAPGGPGRPPYNTS